MKQVFIFLILVVSTNIYAQSLEERAAVLACECIKKQKQLDNEKYRECLSKALADAMVRDRNSEDLSRLNTVTGIQNAILEVQSILSYTCNLLSEKELAAKREKFYSNSENEFARNSYFIANKMMDDKKFDLAIEGFGLALKEDSTFVLALDHTAICYKQLGDLENAVKYYNKSLDVYPEGDLALMNIGVIYTSVGEFEISNKYYSRLANLYPNNPEGFFGLAKNYILLGEFERGLENISIAHKIYKKTKSPYIQDAEKIIEIVGQTMKENGQENEFKKLAKKYGLKTK
jgi:tetratricopeptide (TPR) repeat protein